MTQQVGLEQVAEFFYGDGPAVKGWPGSDEDAVLEAARRYPGRPYCLVRGWMIVDIVSPESLGEAICGQGFFPRIIYAERIVLDSASRFPPGYWVRSSWQVSYSEDGFFESMNTIYILLGDGQQKSAGHWIFTSLF